MDKSTYSNRRSNIYKWFAKCVHHHALVFCIVSYTIRETKCTKDVNKVFKVLKYLGYNSVCKKRLILSFFCKTQLCDPNPDATLNSPLQYPYAFLKNPDNNCLTKATECTCIYRYMNSISVDIIHNGLMVVVLVRLVPDYQVHWKQFLFLTKLETTSFLFLEEAVSPITALARPS